MLQRRRPGATRRAGSIAASLLGCSKRVRIRLSDLVHWSVILVMSSVDEHHSATTHATSCVKHTK